MTCVLLMSVKVLTQWYITNQEKAVEHLGMSQERQGHYLPTDDEPNEHSVHRRHDKPPKVLRTNPYL